MLQQWEKCDINIEDKHRYTRYDELGVCLSNTSFRNRNSVDSFHTTKISTDKVLPRDTVSRCWIRMLHMLHTLFPKTPICLP